MRLDTLGGTLSEVVVPFVMDDLADPIAAARRMLDDADVPMTDRYVYDFATGRILHSEGNPMDRTESFFLVWREPSLSGGDLYDRMPTKRHATRHLAMVEAQRLATKHPGARFHVVKSVAHAQVNLAPPTITEHTCEVGVDEVNAWRRAVGIPDVGKVWPSHPPFEGPSCGTQDPEGPQG